MCYPPYPFESTFTIWQRLIADYAGLSVAILHLATSTTTRRVFRGFHAESPPSA